MRRGMPSTAAANGGSASEMRPSYRSTTSVGSSAVPGASSNGTILVNLDVFIQRATVGHDISPLDEDLIVLFRRNSKEITSEPTRWHSDHVAEWNQHVGIQTSLLRGKKGSTRTTGTNEFLKKEYEVVLVALPSHSAVALFTVDFAELVHPSNPVRHKIYQISPLKCRDLAALLEFEIVWDYAVKQPLLPPSSSARQAQPPSLSTNLLTGNTTSNSLSIAGLPPTSSLLSSLKQQQPSLRTNYPDTSSSMSSRRTTASMSSTTSDRDPLADLAGCSDCRASKRRFERKEMQILQLESFLKESQKRIDSLVVENDELTIREQAETTNAAQYRAVTARLVQELEMAFQFCATQVQHVRQDGAALDATFMFLPQFEFMERVKAFHIELDTLAGATHDDFEELGSHKTRQKPVDAWQQFDFAAEMVAALERNQRLQRQLEFLGRSLAFASTSTSDKVNELVPQAPRLHRTGTQTSADTSGGDSDNSLHDSENGGSESQFYTTRQAFTMTEQLNNLERENFVLKAKLERAIDDLRTLATAKTLETTTTTTTTTTTVPSETDAQSASSRCDGAVDDDDDDDELELLNVELRDAMHANALLVKDKDAMMDKCSELEQALAAANAAIQALEQRVAESVEAAAAAAVGVEDAPTEPTATAPGFLNKIYQDVGKAKMALEEKVKQLNALLRDATDENLRLLATVEAQQEQLALATTASTDDTTQQQRIAELEAALTDASAHLHTIEFELEHATQSANASNHAKRAIELELAASIALGTQAQDRIVVLEQQLHAAEARLESTATTTTIASSSSPATLSSATNNDRSDEVLELSKQLKLAKQEVMQLRYRSNQMESVHEKLDDALKEKRTLEVKLTALEGQLYDHRSRTISDNSFATDQNAVVADLQRQLDTRAAQLLTTQRDLEQLRRECTSQKATETGSLGASPDAVEWADVRANVVRLEAQVAQWSQRNDAHVQQLEALDARIATVTRDRAALEAICAELVSELDAAARAKRARSDLDDEEDDEEDKDKVAANGRTLFAPVAVVVPSPPMPTKVTDRYANALASRDAIANAANAASASAPPPPLNNAPQSKVAHLIKNFSSDDATTTTTDSDGNGSTTPVKRFAKFDFRARHGSTASARSGSSGSAVEAMAARFRSGTASSQRA